MDAIYEQLQHMQEEIDTLRTLVESNAETIQANGLTIQAYGEELRKVQQVVIATGRLSHLLSDHTSWQAENRGGE